MDAQKFLLACFAASPVKGYKPVQIQKLIFLFQERTKELYHLNFFEFSPYNYGPFSSEVYRTIDDFANEGMIETVYYPLDRTRTYQLMPKADSAANAAFNELEPGAKVYLQNLAQWVCSLSFAELVGSVYQEYPEQKKYSVFNQ